MSDPAVASFADDPRLLALARDWLGPAALPYRATLFDKSPTANWLVVWHQDTALPLTARVDVPGWGPWSTKAGVLYAHAPASALEGVVALRIHLDDSSRDNGPLRVLPGTHTRGVLSDAAIQELGPVRRTGRVHRGRGRRRRDAAAAGACVVEVHERHAPACPAHRVRPVVCAGFRPRSCGSLSV